MNSTLKRVLSMTLAIVMVIGMIPAIATHVHAAGTITLDDATIGVACHPEHGFKQT